MTHLTTFKATIRRPRPKADGMVAEFFATNGEAADATLVLGRSELQDAKVRVQMKSDGEDLGAFHAYVRRPQPQISGMVACFFGQDGPDADSISALSLSRFADLPVELSVELVETPDGAAVKPAASRKPVREKGPYAAAAGVLWSSGFLARPETWQELAKSGFPLPADQSVDTCRRWAWESFKALFAVHSMTHLDPQTLIHWATHRRLSQFLPKHYGDTK